MKKITLVFLLIISVIKGYCQYDSQNISMISNWYDPTVVAEPTYGIKYNSIWGYKDTISGKEYAIQGSTAGTYFIEVTNPSTPIVRDYVPGRRAGCIWREYKTYGKYVYMVSDDAAPNSFQIADLSYLPDSVHVVYDSNNLFSRAHAIFIDGDKLYASSVTTTSSYYSMAVYSLANPELPSFIRALNQDFSNPSGVHDMFVKNDTVYASGGYSGLFIYKFDTTFTLINSLTSYPGQGYNHSSVLTPDGKTLAFCDEVPSNLPVKLLDVTDFTNLQVTSTFKSNEGATPHNLYMRDGKLVVAYYKDGLQIFDISDKYNPIRTGYFDTHPQNGTSYAGNAYAGNWGAYTDLPSGIILASDMQNGLFILNADNALSTKELNSSFKQKTVYPNPFSNKININFESGEKGEIAVKLYDIAGKLMYSATKEIVSGNNTIDLNFPFIPAGSYILNVNGKVLSMNQKLIKLN